MKILEMALAVIVIFVAAGVLIIPAEHDAIAAPEPGLTWVNSWIALLLVSGAFWVALAWLLWLLWTTFGGRL